MAVGVPLLASAWSPLLCRHGGKLQLKLLDLLMWARDKVFGLLSCMPAFLPLVSSRLYDFEIAPMSEFLRR